MEKTLIEVPMMHRFAGIDLICARIPLKPIFGQIQECRGLRRFQLRSIQKVTREWQLWRMIHKLNKLFRYGKAQAAVATG